MVSVEYSEELREVNRLLDYHIPEMRTKNELIFFNSCINIIELSIISMKIGFVHKDNLLGRSDCKNALVPKIFWNFLNEFCNENKICAKISKMATNHI